MLTDVFLGTCNPQQTQMELQKVKLLDDHILVLESLIGMISAELEKSTAERERLLRKQEMTACKLTGASAIGATPCNDF